MAYDAKEEAVKMYEAGMPIDGIVEELGVGKGTVYRWFKQMGVDLKKKKYPGKMVQEDVDLLVEEYTTTNKAASTIMRDFGLTPSQFYGLLGKLGIPTRKVEEQDGKDLALEHAIELYQKGWKIVRIYLETGVHAPQLYKELYERGIQTRRNT